MPPTFTKAKALELLANNGINDVKLSFTNRNSYGEKRPYRQWVAETGGKWISEGRYLIEVVRDVLRRYAA